MARIRMTLAVVLVSLLAATLVLTNCKSYDENPVVRFYNTTDSALCYSIPQPDCSDSIKPRGTSRWAVDSCFQQGGVLIYTESGQKIYERIARCEDWGDDAFVVINWRDDKFVVADSIPSPPGSD